MKLDFGYISQVSKSLHSLSKLDPKEHAEGRYVYEIRFRPSNGTCEIHMQWPMFRNLIANEADRPVEIDRLASSSSPAWLHLTGWVQGIEIRACVDKGEVIDDLKAVFGEYPQCDYEICEDDDVLELFVLWQNMTGWNMDWEDSSNG